MTLAELQTEAALDPAITAGGLPLADITVPRHVLLTGATGFVGAFLVRDLLQDTEATIHCLVRAADDEAALARVRQNMTTYGLWEESYVERISGLPGIWDGRSSDLPDPQFAFLAHAIDIIFITGRWLTLFIHIVSTERPTSWERKKCCVWPAAKS